MEQSSPQKGKLITDEVAENITRVEELAYELKIEEVMTREIKVLSPDMKMLEVLEIFRQARISGAPVLFNGVLVGLLSIEDIIRSLRVGDIEAPVRQYMTTKVITVNSFDPVVEGLKAFVHANVGRFPVVDEGGNLVGILTKGDINLGLLKALEHDYQEEEVRRYRASHLFEDIVSDRTSLILRYTIKPRDFTRGGAASSFIKRALLRLGANPQIARRCGIAIYEAEMNLIIHATHGGVIRVEIEPHHIVMDAYDDGPGIEDVQQAMKPGFSTASEEIRELGFGAGMGLANISRCADEMTLESRPGKGTKLHVVFLLQNQDAVGEASTHFEQEKTE